MNVRVFIGSSTEAKKVMRALESDLRKRDFIVKPWLGSFSLAQNTLNELWRIAHEIDFAVFVYAADAELKERGQQFLITRDNIIYEAGLFAGILSPKRVFLVVEEVEDTASKMKIPSDYLGIGYTTYNKSDKDSIQRAGSEIEEAINRIVEEMDAEDDLTLAIEGLWTDAIVSREEKSKSVVSSFQIRRRGPGLIDIINGNTWDVNGEPRAKFWSTSSNFNKANNTLIYSWQGTHPREPVVTEHFGVGELRFNVSDIKKAEGWFSSTPKAAVNETVFISRECIKPDELNAKDFLSEFRETRQKAVKRLLKWREQIR